MYDTLYTHAWSRSIFEDKDLKKSGEKITQNALMDSCRETATQSHRGSKARVTSKSQVSHSLS